MLFHVAVDTINFICLINVNPSKRKKIGTVCLLSLSVSSPTASAPHLIQIRFWAFLSFSISLPHSYQFSTFSTWNTWHRDIESIYYFKKKRKWGWSLYPYSAHSLRQNLVSRVTTTILSLFTVSLSIAFDLSLPPVCRVEHRSSARSSYKLYAM